MHESLGHKIIKFNGKFSSDVRWKDSAKVLIPRDKARTEYLVGVPTSIVRKGGDLAGVPVEVFKVLVQSGANVLLGAERTTEDIHSIRYNGGQLSCFQSGHVLIGGRVGLSFSGI